MGGKRGHSFRRTAGRPAFAVSPNAMSSSLIHPMGLTPYRIISCDLPEGVLDDLSQPIGLVEEVDAVPLSFARGAEAVVDAGGRDHGEDAGAQVQVRIVLVQGHDLDPVVLPAPALPPPEAVGVLGDQIEGDVFETP